jgi:hypothetical protein
MEKITSLTIGMALAIGVFLCATSSAELVMAADNQTGASMSNKAGAMANNTGATAKQTGASMSNKAGAMANNTGATAKQTGASMSNQTQQSANQTNSTNPLSKIPVIGKLFGGK